MGGGKAAAKYIGGGKHIDTRERQMIDARAVDFFVSKVNESNGIDKVRSECLCL